MLLIIISISYRIYLHIFNYNTKINLSFKFQIKKIIFLHLSIMLFMLSDSSQSFEKNIAQYNSKRRKSGRSWSGHRDGKSAERWPNTRVFVVRHLYGYVSMFQFPDLKVFARRQDISSGRSVAQSWSPYAEILDGSFLQPHILLPPFLLLSATISFSSSAASHIQC